VRTRWRANAAAGYTVTVERTEPTASTRAAREDQWYQRVNQECRCAGTTKCGTKLKNIVAEIRTGSAMLSAAQRKKLNRTLLNVRTGWCNAEHRHNSHNRKTAAACDYTTMPRELLPRLNYASNCDDTRFPYVAQNTVNDVRAMRFIRSKANAHNRMFKAHWAALQPRLAEYATSGTGSIAEAILYNDCKWLGQQAHERPSGSKSAAARNRNRKQGTNDGSAQDSSDEDAE
jgi:hypothetical protein